jgi:uroporphyrinogen III methyltransferase/synthase
VSDSFALGGRRIVITRAPEQTTDLVQCLRGLGAEVFFLPMVRFLDPETTDDLDRAIDSLGKFEWLVFSSANAVRFFLKRCRALGRWPSGAMQIAAVGNATRAAVEAEDLMVNVMPEEFSGVALAATLEPEVVGRTILLPRSDRAGDELPGMLRAAGASVSEVIAYRTAEPEALDDASRASLLRGDVDAITFFSPSAVHHFARLLGETGLREVSLRVVYAAVGPVTSAAISNVGLTTAMEADEASPTSLAMALVRYFAAHPVAKERI